MDRRQFLATSVGTAAALTVGTDLVAVSAGAQSDPGPYGPLGPPDANGFSLPEGFSSRLLALAGEPVDGTDYQWLPAPDGGATFAVEDGGWAYAVNAEAPPPDGGVGALRFDDHGAVVDAYRILDGTARNCAGGPTPWSTWLSCEEHPNGRVWECDPFGPGQGEVRPALGVFQHEAVTVDPEREQLFLTEDAEDGGFYRFTPDAYPDLSSGTLEIARLADGDTLSWLPLPDPSASETPTRYQVAEATPFDGGEGIWFHEGIVYFTTKGTDQVHAYDPVSGGYEVIYDPVTTGGPLNGVDNITVDEDSGDLIVAEDHGPDGGPLELVVITQLGTVSVLARVDHPGSELTGPAFSPDGARLYVSSQRAGPTRTGATYEISGPFRGPVPDRSSEGSERATEGAEEPADDDVTPFVVGGGLLGLAAVGGAVAWLRRRRPSA